MRACSCEQFIPSTGGRNPWGVATIFKRQRHCWAQEEPRNMKPGGTFYFIAEAATIAAHDGFMGHPAGSMV